MESTKITLSNSANFDNFETVVCIDGSYVIYHVLYSAQKKWISESQFSDDLTSIDVKDPDFKQIDLTDYDDFNDIAKGCLISTLTKISSMVKDFNSIMCSSTNGNMLFVLDPEHGVQTRSWRYLLYPEYKGQRSSANEKKPFIVYRAFNKVLEILRDGGILEKRFGLDIVSADRAEADDIIATVFTSEKTNGFKKFLIASDHDYLQLDGITQMTLEGKQVEIEQPYPELINVTPETYLLAKIIVGDTSDNITQVFQRVGYKTAIKKFIANPEYLTESLVNDVVAMEKFKRNERLIDFKRIPKKIRDIALRAVSL